MHEACHSEMNESSVTGMFQKKPLPLGEVISGRESKEEAGLLSSKTTVHGHAASYLRTNIKQNISVFMSCLFPINFSGLATLLCHGLVDIGA